jgi:hypothetical protein
MLSFAARKNPKSEIRNPKQIENPNGSETPESSDHQPWTRLRAMNRSEERGQLVRACLFSGVRPSSATASSARSDALDFSETPPLLDAAAPEDGRPPLNAGVRANTCGEGKRVDKLSPLQSNG